MLHIHNGDSSANTLKQSTIAGENLAFRESLITGPTPGNLAAADWRQLRANHLAENYGVKRADVEQQLLLQEEALNRYIDHDEVVLWFEYDLFCQVHLVYLLDWFKGRDFGRTKLSLICIDRFPGVENFRGLGQLNAGQLASLFETRQQVTAAQLQLGSAAWTAYCSADPRAIEGLLREDTAALPYLRAAFSGHLARFPSVTNGLGHIENRSLELVNQGIRRFVDLFAQFGEAETVYGLGDYQFWVTLKRIGDAPQALLVFENGQTLESPLDSGHLRTTRVEITEPGKATLLGASDFVETNGLEQWLGGVHLAADRLWRWDEAKGKLVQPEIPERPVS